MTSAARPYDVLYDGNQRHSAGLGELYTRAGFAGLPSTSLTLKMTSRVAASDVSGTVI
ncbi:hypothetical protein DPMN_192910 [Dreissena polymorpha]|uniref:Uncharacterized protein n=1 Tax=Dreissena polymorpha TaxID=45954 RepID=A0A9D4BBP8_DREPO|nr:hypothetical protein DPMN_192910 [Dreissena polymorpha]